MLPYNDSSSGGPAITCLSPTRGMTPEVLLANDSGYYGGGGGSLSQAASPRQQVFTYSISQSWMPEKYWEPCTNSVSTNSWLFNPPLPLDVNSILASTKPPKTVL